MLKEHWYGSAKTYVSDQRKLYNNHKFISAPTIITINLTNVVVTADFPPTPHIYNATL